MYETESFINNGSQAHRAPAEVGSGPTRPTRTPTDSAVPIELLRISSIPVADYRIAWIVSNRVAQNFRARYLFARYPDPEFSCPCDEPTSENEPIKAYPLPQMLMSSSDKTDRSSQELDAGAGLFKTTWMALYSVRVSSIVRLFSACPASSGLGGQDAPILMVPMSRGGAGGGAGDEKF